MSALEDMTNKFTVIKNEDVEKYLSKHFLKTHFDNAIHLINGMRKSEGKKNDNYYLVINMDEPYADEVIEIMKRHGHCGSDS